jgi:alkylation response protein AidB-like acyl-CoA dehydrogenase
MDLRLSSEQEQLVDAFAGLLGRYSTPEHVRAAEPVGFDPELWKRVGELGAVPMAVAEERGGWGASMEDLALVAEQLGRAVAPVPVIEAQVAARALARIDGDVADAALGSALDGARLLTFAPRSVASTVAELVPAAAIADDAVVLRGDELVLVPLRDGARRPIENLGCSPLADVDVRRDAVLLARGAGARAVHRHALDEWLTLTAAALVGIAARALEIGVEYVKVRTVGGTPIGRLQAISHPLADSATAIDGARLLAYEAAWAQGDDPDRSSELSAMAFVFAYECARDVTLRSLRFHGGYGFMMEYDIQLYYRRARAWANIFGEPVTLLRRVADARYGPVDGRGG